MLSPDSLDTFLYLRYLCIQKVQILLDAALTHRTTVRTALGEMGTRWGINRTVAQVHARLRFRPRRCTPREIARRCRWPVPT